MVADGRPTKERDTRVLVVDDEPGLADLYRLWLEEAYDVRAVYSGDVALETLAENPVDVVLLDRMMPGRSGDEVARCLHETGFDGQVVVVTAIPPAREMAGLPVEDYLVKPVDRTRLVEAVETAVLAAKYDDRVTELFSLASRRRALEAASTAPPDVEDSERAALDARIRRLRRSTRDTFEALERRLDVDVAARTSPELTRRQIDRPRL